MRIKGESGAIDYSAEVPYQFGEWGTDDLSAIAAHADVGLTFVDHPWKPRIGAEYSFASGDRNPTDGKRQTFDNLFPTNHLHYGYMDLFSWRNIRHWGFVASVEPTKKLLAKANFHIFGLDEAKDAWYNAGGKVLRRSSTGHVNRDVGKELDLTLKYELNKNVSIMTGYSHFFAGDFVRDTSPTGERDEADWMYLMVDTKF